MQVSAHYSTWKQDYEYVSETAQWLALKEHVFAIERTHLRELMKDQERFEDCLMEHNGVYVDFSRQRVTSKTLDLLIELAQRAGVEQKIKAMFSGDHINATEDRAVLHAALRAPESEVIMVDGKNVVPDVHEVLQKIEEFSSLVRNGEWVGVTGLPLTDVVCIGIGGSFLGPLFVDTAIAKAPSSMATASGRRLRFLANVDPVDVANSLTGFSPETTLVVVVSKTFTTAETMLNARTVRTWITEGLGKEAVAKHMVAVSTNLKLVKEFGIDPENAFAFWDWVGGRYSVTSAVGILPLALQYGMDEAYKFLEGAWDIDNHFRSAPLRDNLPVMLGMLSLWNVSFLGYPSRAILPYTQALAKLAPHIQQVSMESNGKGVDMDGRPLPYQCGEVDFGEPGTNGQHSFYQLIHQGRVIPCDFIGTVKSQQSVYLKGEIVSNHDELMCNFFAQADALAFGKTKAELRSENVRHTCASGAQQLGTGDRELVPVDRTEARAADGRFCAWVGVWCRVGAGPPHHAQDVHRQPPVAVRAGAAAGRVLHGAAAGAVRAPRGGSGLRVGHQQLRPVGRGAGQGSRHQGARTPTRLYPTVPGRCSSSGALPVDPTGLDQSPHLDPIRTRFSVRARVLNTSVCRHQVRTIMNQARTEGRRITASDGLSISTTALLNRYLDGKAKLIYDEPRDVFPCELLDGEFCSTK